MDTTKEKIRMTEYNKKAWPLVDEKLEIMSAYLSDGEFVEGTDAEDIFKLMLGCLAIVVGELYANTDNYRKYESKDYAEEDFVDMVIESIAQKFPDKNDTDKVAEYVENFRAILWGHARCHSLNYFKLYINLNEYVKDGSTVDFLRECMTIVTIERVLRTMEQHVKK